MIADHTEEIDYLRAKVAGFLNQTPPKRSLAKKYGNKLNTLIVLQIRRELQIEKKQHEASRRHVQSPRASLPQDGGSPHPETTTATANR